MSFSRAPLKRFNENVGCAPAPGSYEIKPGDLKGAASFDKSDRFRLVKAAALPPPSPSRSALMSPVRRTLSVDGLMEGSSVKKEKNYMTMERKQQKLLEKEIRSLVQQRGEQDRRLLALEEEMKKVEAKLLAAVREKTGLAANVTTLERQRAELKKINEFLKNKVSADTTKKRINSLTMELMEARNTLDAKNKELSVLQINTEGQLKLLETDLQAARATATALKDRNKDLEDLHKVTKTQNEDLENENARLHAVIRELREENKVLQGYLDTANDQIQSSSVDHHINLSFFHRQLETELLQQSTELESTQGMLRQKEEEAQKFQQELQASKDALIAVEKLLDNQMLELKSSQKSVSDMEEQIKSANQEIQDSQATVRQQEAELARLREVLRRTEKELDERVAHLEQRYLFSEEERSKAQEQGFRRVEELKTEIALLKEAKRDEKRRQIQLEQEHATLTEELAKEKVTQTFLILLEVQTRLAQKDEEMTAMEASHASLISQLQQELQLQTKGREEALGQVEEQRGQSVTQLQNEKEKAWKLLEEVSQEKEEIMEQLQREREEKGKIQTALQEERGALVVERKDHQQVKSEVLRLQTELERVEEESKSLLSQVELKDQSRLALENQLNKAEQDKNRLQSRLDEVEQGRSSFQAQLDLMEEKTRAVQLLTQEKVTLQWEMEEQRQELQRQITEAQEKSSQSSETEHWRNQYEELFAKVRPFQEQLNAFAAERNALLNENGANQEELNKLSDAYARLLGHQNQKQKIKHVMKLKDENIFLKQEMSKLRSQVNRQKSDLEQLKSKLPGTPRRKFDPSKAFQHDKENRQTETTETLKGEH
uniref:Hyaluronan-mediated motility receptor C-terminal domain-containing protein n=1 Tax=Dicentrarchus labrax TaxID=13489 RepID=A0A8C4EGV9_DICLA